MKITTLSDKRLLLEFPTRKEMTLSNFRIAEFYEGKEGIKGNYFTTDQFLDKYSDDNGNIDYFSYWEGFNYPFKTVLEFREKFGYLSEREKLIVDACFNIDREGYVISCVEGDEITLKHETAHALFFENEEYKKEVTKIINTLDLQTLAKFKAHLSLLGYCEDVFTDEMQAYLIAFDEKEWQECFSTISEDEIYSHRPNLQATFDFYNK